MLSFCITCPATLLGDHLPLTTRSDLAAISRLFCASTGLDQTQVLRDNDVWDLHLKGGVLSAPTPRAAERFVRNFAEKQGYIGYSVAACLPSTKTKTGPGSKRYGFSVVPAPIPWNLWFKKPKPDFCKQTKITAASTDISRPLRTIVSRKSINPKDYVSVSCKIGKTYKAMYLYEPKNRLDENSFYQKISRRTAPKILADMRLKASLGKVNFFAMPKALKQEILNQTVEHDPKTINVAKQLLGDKHFVGELKVFAKDWPEAIWNLWRSPSHRKVLYSKTVTKMYLAKAPLQGSRDLFQFAIVAMH